MDQPAIEELVVGRALFVEDREDLAILQPLADGVEFGGEVGSVHGPSYRAPPLAPRRSRIGPGLAMRRRALAGARDTHVGNSPEIGRASCRVRGCTYVEFSGVAVTLKKKK